MAALPTSRPPATNHAPPANTCRLPQMSVEASNTFKFMAASFMSLAVMVGACLVGFGGLGRLLWHAPACSGLLLLVHQWRRHGPWPCCHCVRDDLPTRSGCPMLSPLEAAAAACSAHPCMCSAHPRCMCSLPLLLHSSRPADLHHHAPDGSRVCPEVVSCLCYAVWEVFSGGQGHEPTACQPASTSSLLPCSLAPGCRPPLVRRVFLKHRSYRFCPPSACECSGVGQRQHAARRAQAGTL